MAIIKLNNNALTSVTELPSGVGADPNVKVDLARLGLRVFANQNLASTSSNSIFYDVFQDGSGISANTNAPRNAEEFVSSVVTTTTNFAPDLHRYSNYTGGTNDITYTDAGGATDGQYIRNHSDVGNTSNYSGVFIDELFDLGAGDFKCKGFTNDADGSGTFRTQADVGVAVLITTDTSIAAGSNPDIFSSSLVSNNIYGYVSNDSGQTTYTSLFSTAAQSAFGISSVGRSAASSSYGNDVTYDISSASRLVSHYSNTVSAGGIFVDYDKSANQMLIKFNSSATAQFANPTITVNNVPSSGRAVIMYGHANNTTRRFETSNTSGTIASGQMSVKTSVTASATGNFTSSTITAPSSVNKLSAVITYKDHAGTNSLNTDLVLQLSADNGSNFSTATLTALPDFATGVKCCKVTDLSVTAGTQIKYKISFANQAQGSKECRITGVSLQF